MLKIKENKKAFLMTIRNSVLNVFDGRKFLQADSLITVNEDDFKYMMLGMTDPSQLISENKLHFEGSQNVLEDFIKLFDNFPKRFPIVTP